MSEKILVIDDDPNIAELINVILKPRGLLTYHAVDGQEGLKQAYELQPDLIILDIMMPVHNGYEICARLRELSDVPIIMLTAKSQSADITRGFAVGADDYVKKPFSNEELVSRIESLLRRKKSTDVTKKITSYSDGHLEVAFASQKVMLDDEEISLTPTEFNLLVFLIRHPNKTLSTRAILTELWGDAYSHDKALLSLYIHQLRQKLNEGEREHKYIQTQWGQGYWFNPLPQSPKPSTVPEVIEQGQEESEYEEEETPIEFYKNRLLWVALGILIGVLAYVLYQQYSSFLFSHRIAANLAEGHTNIEAQMTAEGFREADNSEVRGEICVKNAGNFPTENLSIVNTIQDINTPTARNYSGTVDLSAKPVLRPGEIHCYPFEITFEPDLQQDAQYQIKTVITITNHIGLAAGSTYCPGPQPCPFGPEISTDINLPEP